MSRLNSLDVFSENEPSEFEYPSKGSDLKYSINEDKKPSLSFDVKKLVTVELANGQLVDCMPEMAQYWDLKPKKPNTKVYEDVREIRDLFRSLGIRVGRLAELKELGIPDKLKLVEANLCRYDLSMCILRRARNSLWFLYECISKPMQWEAWWHLECFLPAYLFPPFHPVLAIKLQYVQDPARRKLVGQRFNHFEWGVHENVPFTPKLGAYVRRSKRVGNCSPAPVLLLILLFLPIILAAPSAVVLDQVVMYFDSFLEFCKYWHVDFQDIDFIDFLTLVWTRNFRANDFASIQECHRFVMIGLESLVQRMRIRSVSMVSAFGLF